MIPQKTTTISLKVEETSNSKAREVEFRGESVACYTTCFCYTEI